MAGTSRSAKAFFDPENPKDADILLLLLDDDDLEKECEKVLSSLGQFSDTEADSDQEIETTFNDIPAISRVVGRDIELIPETIALPEREQNESSKEMKVTKKLDINWKKGSFLKYKFITGNIGTENNDNSENNFVSVNHH
nr:uncharacterized protein LOC111502145 [Leptinotarsa decemlineata]